MKKVFLFFIFLSQTVFAQTKSFSSLKEVFADKAELAELSGTRVFNLNSESPVVDLGNNAKKPFAVFQIAEMRTEQTDLVIRTQALSQSLSRVGMSNPRVFILSENGQAIEVPRKEEAHSSEVGSCLKSGYSFEIKSLFKAGLKVVVVNTATGLTNSLGQVVAGNPSFKLKKTNGFCSMVEVFPTLEARYEISLE
jgi:hypothetical protein